ncbi:DUF512 domain-containing protein [Clostridium cellulovorans]|uniref:PDZ domain-containing protein n=1 Tax=Clostridium cellulovorans (strain ATCC 35296 / DSM 3052 / OCM 3 / 743B) TaxID=573061 RepID=D9SL89_CLOC7|nr:DUF512 domain-containing protein [Clostridium cellulovorans]ADL51605.1 protein of unknown function DUF512 [Clostridium cellulovorans 743B]
MRNIISKVDKDSIGEEVGIEAGDKLLLINDTEVKDIIDYKYLIVDEDVVITIEKADGEIWDIEIEKEFGEDIGLEFKEGIMDKPMSCHNKCIFCFIDQLPKGMRETLYFKDDDSRLSFLQGNFITLTNMKDDDIDRIIRYRISPINVSVHTTNPELRREMLNNRFAGELMEKLKKLADAGITINTQIVLCPEINNGEELVRTINDLYSLYPAVRNVAAVPIGITKFREGLKELKVYDKESANSEIETVNKLQEQFYKEIGEPFIRLSDEFYILAEKTIPEKEFYSEFEQLEDGIGVIRMFRDNIEDAVDSLKDNICGHFTIPTGVSAYKEIQEAALKIMKKSPKVRIDVVKIINNYFGETITVTGLITGTDLINQLKGKDVGTLIMSNVMFRKGYELGDYEDNIMLDNYTIGDIQNTLGTTVKITDYTGEDLIEIINENSQEE